MSKKIYAYLDEANRIKAIIPNKEQAKIISNTGGRVVRIKKSLLSEIKEFPVDKEVVALYGVPMSPDEEEEVIQEFYDRIGTLLDAMDRYIVLLPYLKLPENLKYQLEEFSFYLSNMTETLGNNYDDDYTYTLDMTGLFTDIIVDIRKRRNY